MTGITIGNLDLPTYFRAVVKSGNCVEVNSSKILISIDSVSVGGTISGNSLVCAGNTSGLITLSGQTGNVVKWQHAVLVSNVWTWSDISHTATTYTSDPLTESTRFRVEVKSGACSVDYSNNILITVRPNPSFTNGSVSSPVCYGDSVEFTANGLLPNINNTFNYEVTIGSTVINGVKNSVSNASGVASYSESGFSPESYSFKLTSIVVAGCTTIINQAPVVFIVNPLPTASITGSTTVCAGTTPEPEIVLTGANGTSPYTFTYTINSGGNLTAVSTGNAIGLPQSTSGSGNFVYNLVSIADNNACSQLQTGTATITVDPVSVGGSISGTSTITYGSSTGTMTLSGYSGSILHWEKKLNTGSWTSISNTTSTYNEIPTDAGSWYYRVVIKNGVCAETNSDHFIITVNKKSLNIKADDKTKIYDGLVYSPFTVSYTGFVPGETSSVLGGVLSFSGNATSAKDFGNYTIVPGGLSSDNYNISFSSGSLNIYKASSTIVRNILNNGYGSLRDAIINVSDAGTVSFIDGINGQTIGLTTGTLTIDKNITFDNSNHSIGITISGSGDNITINTGKKLTIASNSKITVIGAIKNNPGISGLQIESGASFIQNNIDLAATVKRELSNKWHLFGSPFKKNIGAILSNITPVAGSVQMKPYTNGTDWITNVTSPNYYLLPTQGYAVNPNITFTASLSGNLYYSPTSFDYTNTLVYTGTSSTQSWNLIANPYTSYLDWRLLGKTNLNNSLYLWDNSLYSSVSPVANTSYLSTYNAQTGVGVPSGTKPYIASLQGFFVKAINTSPKLSFPPTARVHTTSNYYKDASSTEILVRLKTETEEGYDELVICRNPEAKLDFEGFDAEKMFNGNPLEMYTQSTTGERLVINTINTTIQTIIPLGINGNSGKKAKITAFGLETAENVYLEDRYKGKFISLSENTTYDFEFPTDNITGRFFIRFGDINTAFTTSDIKVFESDNILNIIAQYCEEIQNIEIYSVTGACVYSKDYNKGNMYTIPLDIPIGVYLVRVKTSLDTKNIKVNWK
ncbi:MAG: MBG domain-containing protein [Bacteroidales bacterium]